MTQTPSFTNGVRKGQRRPSPKQGASADRIKHIRNEGEQSIRTTNNIYFVEWGERRKTNKKNGGTLVAPSW